MDRKKVLVADDDASILDVMKLILEQMGNYEVTTTLDGESVLEYQDNLPDLILLDLWMSGVKGSDICRQLRKNTRTSSIPIIIFSASPDVKIEAIKSGADDYITKPFQIPDLLEKVDKFTS